MIAPLETGASHKLLLTILGITIVWFFSYNGAPRTRNVPQSLIQYKDRKHELFSCAYPRGWKIREAEDTQIYHVAFFGPEAGIRVRINLVQGNEVPSLELTEMVKEKAQELLPKDEVTFISGRYVEVTGTSAYEIEYRQNRPQARCRAVILYANRRLHILMFAAPTDSLFTKWSHQFSQFLTSYNVPECKPGNLLPSPQARTSTDVRLWKLYTDPKGRFACRVPSGWIIDEKRKDPRSRVRFFRKDAEISIISRETERHILDESDRREMVTLQQAVVKRAQVMGQKARTIGVEWANVGGTKALKVDTEVIRPQWTWFRQMKFKRGVWDHTITLTVKSSEQCKDIESLFDKFLEEYRSPPSKLSSGQESNSVKMRPEIATPPMISNTKLVSFLSAEGVQELLVSSGTDSLDMPQFKVKKATPGFYFCIVESRINTLAWPREKIEFGGQDGVNIKSSEIVLQTTDGQLIHPSFASYMTDPGTKKRGFAPGPLRNIALVFGHGAVDGKPVGIMSIYVARPGLGKDLVAVEKGGSIDPDPGAFPLYFAFSVPIGSRIKEVGLSFRRQ